MLESEELIQKVLATDGTSLIFGAGTILGSPLFSFDLLITEELSVARIEKQSFSFLISTKDAVIYTITVDDEFTTADNTYKYHFIASNRPISFTDGWSKLSADLLERELL